MTNKEIAFFLGCQFWSAAAMVTDGWKTPFSALMSLACLVIYMLELRRNHFHWKRHDGDKSA